jgi:hypothetical protein
MARAWGGTAKEKAHLEFNARNVLTLWGPNGEIAGPPLSVAAPPPQLPRRRVPAGGEGVWVDQSPPPAATALVSELASPGCWSSWVGLAWTCWGAGWVMELAPDLIPGAGVGLGGADYASKQWSGLLSDFYLPRCVGSGARAASARVPAIP